MLESRIYEGHVWLTEAHARRIVEMCRRLRRDLDEVAGN